MSKKVNIKVSTRWLAYNYEEDMHYIAFGKHEGTSLRELLHSNAGYLSWFIGTDIDKVTISIIETYAEDEDIEL